MNRTNTIQDYQNLRMAADKGCYYDGCGELVNWTKTAEGSILEHYDNPVLRSSCEDAAMRPKPRKEDDGILQCRVATQSTLDKIRSVLRVDIDMLAAAFDPHGKMYLDIDTKTGGASLNFRTTVAHLYSVFKEEMDADLARPISLIRSSEQVRLLKVGEASAEVVYVGLYRNPADHPMHFSFGIDCPPGVRNINAKVDLSESVDEFMTSPPSVRCFILRILTHCSFAKPT